MGGQFDHNVFDNIDTEQKAYILGLLQCDGSFSCKGRLYGYYRYKISLQQADVDILENIQNYLGHTGKISYHDPKIVNRQVMCELSLNGIKFTEKLKEIYGGYTKLDRLNIPNFESSLTRHYVRGVFDADGSFGDNTGYAFRIEGKIAFLEKIRKLLPLKTEIKKGNGDTTYTLRVNGEDAIYLAYWLYSDLQPDSLYIQRKYDKFNEICKRRNFELWEAV